MLKNGITEPVEPKDFRISPIANLDAIRVLRREGVSRITLGTSLFTASLAYEKRHLPENAYLENLRSLACTFFPNEENTPARFEDNDDLANLSASLVIKLDGRKRSEVVAEKAITDAAINLYNNLEGDLAGEVFSIQTRNGNKVTHESIRISKKVSVPASGNSVSKLDAWNQMASYIQDLRSTGALTQ